MKIMMTYIILILSIFIRCGVEKGTKPLLHTDKTEDISIQVTNASDSLELLTTYKKDTLNVVDWEEDKFSNPVIVKQVLKFYNNLQLVKEHELPIKYKLQKNVKGQTLNVPVVPITNICYHKGINGDYFIIGGSDFCMGVLCPEFTGIYQMDGSPIFEATSTESKDKFRIDLVKLIESTGIQINKPDKCMSLIKDSKFWDK